MAGEMSRLGETGFIAKIIIFKCQISKSLLKKAITFVLTNVL